MVRFNAPRLNAPRLLALATVGILTLVGCAAGAQKPQAEIVDGVPLAEVTALEDPRSYIGPSTASLVDSDLHPVAENPTPQLPVTVTDAQGTEVTITDTSRVLALDIYGTLARTVVELGHGSALVGRDTSSQFPEVADLPLVTANGHELSAESILALEPTLIITDTTLGPWDVVLQMREAGIPVVVLDSTRTLEGSSDLIRSVAGALGLPAEGELLAERTDADIEATVQAIKEIAPQSDDALSMAFLYVRGASGIYYLFGGESGTGDLITSLGGRDIATEIGWTGMKPVTDEGIIAMQPEVLIVMTKGLESAGGVDGLLESVPALAETPAGMNRRIVDMSDSDVLSFGPATADVLEALAVAIYAPDDAIAAQAAGE